MSFFFTFDLNNVSLNFLICLSFYLQTGINDTYRGGEWYLEKRGSRKIMAGCRNLGSVFDESRSLVFPWFVFICFESRNFLPKSLGLGFLTRISASRRVSDFTIRHPYISWSQVREEICENMTPPKMPPRRLNVCLPLRPNSLQGSGFLVSGTCGRHKCNNWTQV